MQTRREFAARLHETTLGCKLSRSQFGSSRKVNEDQKQQMAQLFDADCERLSASKKLLNKRHKAYLAVTSLLGQAGEIWKNATVPFPEPGVRLIRRDLIPKFVAQLQQVSDELAVARAELERVYQEELIPDAQQRLGYLFNESDYPESIAEEFAIEWSFPSVDPPEYLRQVSPALYEQQQALVQSRFEQAVALTEQAFVAEFADIVSHLVERLTPEADGKRKVFRDTAVENLSEFFERFRQLNLGSSGELDALVAQAQEVVKGVNAQALRKDVTAQEAVRDAMASLGGRLDALLVDKPNRKIKLSAKSAAAPVEHAAPVAAEPEQPEPEQVPDESEAVLA